MTTTPAPSITDDQLAEIEALAREATPSPWVIERSPFEVYNVDHGALTHHISSGYIMIAALYDNEGSDARLMAAASPATILAMIARIRELEKMLILAKSVVDWAAEEGEASADLMAIAQARAVVIESAINNRSGEQE